MGGQTNINTCRPSELNKQKINIGLNNILRKFVTKLPKYRILFKDILKFLGLDYWEASLIILYYVVLGLCGNDERVATPTLKSYLTFIGIKRAKCYGQTGVNIDRHTNGPKIYW